MCNNEDVSMTDGVMAIQVSPNTPSSRGGGPRTCMSAVELGKRLLLHSRDGDTDEIKSLISRGAPFTTDWLGTSPLHLAAMNGHTETAEVLLRGGISRDARTKVDRTPLHIAAQEGHADIVDLLLSHGADIESTDMLRMTPLHWAVDRGHADTVLKLLEHGANPNAVSKFDKTPIILAIDNNRVDILDLLQNTSLYIHKETEDHFMSQLDEAGSAAENLMVISGEAPAEEEEVHTSQSESPVPQQGAACSLSASTEGIEIISEGIQINFLNPSDKASPKSKPKPSVIAGSSSSSSSTAQSNIQFLKAHGITMLPADDSNIVASAMESGQTVVLTEAGKLALNQTRIGQVKKNTVAVASSSAPAKSTRKVVAISAGQLAMITGKVTKMVPVGKKLSFSPARLKSKTEGVTTVSRIITTTTGKRVFPSSSPVSKAAQEKARMEQEDHEMLAEEEEAAQREEQDPLDDRPPDDMETMARKLAQAKKEAEEYRKQLLQKEQEAEEYMKKLKSLTK